MGLPGLIRRILMRRPITVMREMALEVVGMLSLSCTRIAIAGSIRRGRAEVKDIEIVAMSAGEALHITLDELVRLRVIGQRSKSDGSRLAWGPRYKAALYRGVAVDVFIVGPDRQWGPTMALRTGPGEANEALVTTVGVHTRNGVRGILPPGLAWRDGAIWQGNDPLDTPEEADVFAACGLPYIAPPLRSADVYGTWARREWPRGTVGCLQALDDVWVDGEPWVVRAQVSEQMEPMRQEVLL